MAEINGISDGGYSYQVRRLEDLEEDLRSEAQKKARQDDERVDRIEGNYKTNLEKSQRQMEETIETVKKTASEDVGREREFAKGEIERMKAATYDRFGRYGGESADTLKRQLEDAVHSWETRHENDRRTLLDAEDANERRLGEQNRHHAAELEKVVETARDSATASYSKAFNDQETVFDQQKIEANKRYERLNQEQMEALNFQRRETERKLGDATRDFEHRVRHLQESNDDRLEMMRRSYDDRADRAVRQMSHDRAAEGRELREQIKDLVEAQGDNAKGYAEGRAAAFEEHEREYRAQMTRVQDAFAQEIAQIKDEGEAAESYLSHQHQSNIKDRERYYAGVIKEMTTEAHQRERELQNTFNRDRGTMELRQQRDRELARQTLENQLHDANVQRDQALEHQAKAYQETMDRNRQVAAEQIKLLEKELQTASTSEDTSVISPAAEAAVRKNVVKEYEKQFEAERARNKGTINSIQKELTSRYQDAVEERRATVTNLEMQRAQERHHSQKEILSHIQDTEFMKDTTLRNQQLDHDRENESTNRQYAQMMDRQRKQYEEILVAQRNDAIAKQQALRQDAEFTSKMQARAFTSRQNELIREYERKLADQKTDNDSRIQDVKVEADRAIRESERRQRIDLEQQARSFEQRIAQLEAQHKERERYIEASYQEDMEKARRANAEQIRKKS